VRAKIASWRRVGPNVVPHVAKATGIYLNSILARVEAEQGGYEEAILLTHDGYIADGSAENVFVVRGSQISTPPLSTSILPGITRETVISLARHLGYEVVEEQLIRTDLYLADEAFVTGTAAEVLPLRSVDDFPIGNGSRPVTERLREAYADLVRGRLPQFSGWVEPFAASTRDRA
jgi:branched-chain amino acid aminotransferase